jgi:hypothetical protein
MAESHPATAPRISRISWGRLIVDGHGMFKDVKAYPGGAREWDWRETGTRHSPGIQPADVEELLSRGASLVILGTGVFGRLGVCPETLEILEARNVPALVLKTGEAVRRYNEERERGPVGALLHSTC